jgi:hypothetical protein
VRVEARGRPARGLLGKLALGTPESVGSHLCDCLRDGYLQRIAAYEPRLRQPVSFVGELEQPAVCMRM